MIGINYILNYDDFYLEKLLGVFILVFPHVDNDEFLLDNQQVLISPFDVYGTLINIIFGDDINAPYGEYPKSLFHKINSTERFCDYYPLEKPEYCRCVNITN